MAGIGYQPSGVPLTAVTYGIDSQLQKHINVPVSLMTPYNKGSHTGNRCMRDTDNHVHSERGEVTNAHPVSAGLAHPYRDSRHEARYCGR